MISYKIGDRVAYVNSTDISYVDKYRDKKGNPAIAEVLEVHFGGRVSARVLTGPEKGAIGLFLNSEIVPEKDQPVPCPECNAWRLWYKR